jgi:AcrR family transcriptional regulator
MAKRSPRARIQPRKNPTQERSADTVEAILEAAARILEDEGFEGYNTNAVASRAGVSIGSLYQYFPNKDAITRSLLQRETAPLKAEFAEVRNAPNTREGLLRVIRAAVSHQLRRPTLARLLDFEEARLPLSSEDRDVGEIACDSLEDLLSKDGIARTASLRLSVKDVLAIVRGMVDNAGERAERDSKSLEARVASAVFGYLRDSKVIKL